MGIASLSVAFTTRRAQKVITLPYSLLDLEREGDVLEKKETAVAIHRQPNLDDQSIQCAAYLDWTPLDATSQGAARQGEDEKSKNEEVGRATSDFFKRTDVFSSSGFGASRHGTAAPGTARQGNEEEN